MSGKQEPSQQPRRSSRIRKKPKKSKNTSKTEKKQLRSYQPKTPSTSKTKKKNKKIKRTSRRRSLSRRRKKSTTTNFITKALHQFYHSMCALFSDGIRAAMNKLETRLTLRGMTVKFVQEWRKQLKLIMAANDLCEGLIASTKALHHLSHAYDHKIAGDLVSFHLNQTKNILSNQQTISGAEQHIYGKSLRGMHKESQAKKIQKNIDLYNMKKKKSEDEKKQLADKKQKCIAKYNHHNDLFEKGLFGASERDFKTQYSRYVQSFKHRRTNLINKKQEYIKERLRYFVHCLDLRSECSIKLSGSLQNLENKMYKICETYGVWTNGSYIQIRDAYLRQLEEPEGLFHDVSQVVGGAEYHYHYDNAEATTHTEGNESNDRYVSQNNAISGLGAVLPSLHLFEDQEMPDPD
eukprot:573264_1